MSLNQEYTTEVERKIALRIVDDALAMGYCVSVNDGEETVVSKSSDREMILSSMATTDADILYFHKGTMACGWVSLIWGNGTDLLSDSSVGEEIDAILRGANALADSLEK